VDIDIFSFKRAQGALFLIRTQQGCVKHSTWCKRVTRRGSPFRTGLDLGAARGGCESVCRRLGVHRLPQSNGTRAGKYRRPSVDQSSSSPPQVPSVLTRDGAVRPVYELLHVTGQLLVAALLTGVCRSRSMQLRRANRAVGMVHVATRLLRDSEKPTLAAHFPLFICLLTLWGTWRCQSVRYRARWEAVLMRRRPRAVRRVDLQSEGK